MPQTAPSHAPTPTTTPQSLSQTADGLSRALPTSQNVPTLAVPDGGRSRYRGSSLLASGLQRVMVTAPLVLALWALCGWALGWWSA